jgi:hypothetical protein
MSETKQSRGDAIVPRETAEPIAPRLVGVWKLVSFATQQEGHEDIFPFGLKPEGLLIYTPDGFVSAQLMKPGRPLFESSDWDEGTPEEYRASGSGYISYCGVYTVDEENETVTHIPSVALLPNLILKEQRRSITFDGDRLILCVRVAEADKDSMISRLEWQKAGASIIGT